MSKRKESIDTESVNEEEYDEENDEVEDEILIDAVEDDETKQEDEIETEYQVSEYTTKHMTVIKEVELKGDKRVTRNILTSYEMVRILGERTKQLTMGAKPMVKNYLGLSYDRIAEEELKLKMIPFKLKRPLPNNKFEIWCLDELNIEHLLTLL